MGRELGRVIKFYNSFFFVKVGAASSSATKKIGGAVIERRLTWAENLGAS